MTENPDMLRAAARLVDEMGERLRRERRHGSDQRARIALCDELATEMRQRAIQAEQERVTSDGQ
jgi:hypothetical protein